MIDWIPNIDLNIPSAVEALKLDKDLLGIERLWVKRDDLIHPQLTGNKWRKLQPWLKKALRENKKKLVSFGGAYSNHLHALASVANMLDLKSIGFLRGEESALLSNSIIQSCMLLGMEIRQVSRSDYRSKEELIQKMSLSSDSMVIPEGGSGEKGVIGSREIAREIKFWSDSTGNKIDCILLPVGTGTTMAGISAELLDLEANCSVFGALSLKGPVNPSFRAYCYQSNPRAKLYKFDELGKYGKKEATLLELRHEFIEQSKIWIDELYAPRCLYLLKKLVKERIIRPEANIMILHTGGYRGDHSKINE